MRRIGGHTPCAKLLTENSHFRNPNTPRSICATPRKSLWTSSPTPRTFGLTARIIRLWRFEYHLYHRNTALHCTATATISVELARSELGRLLPHAAVCAAQTNERDRVHLTTLRYAGNEGVTHTSRGSRDPFTFLCYTPILTE